MSNDVDWDKADSVEVSQGTFIGWGKVGQVVAGTVMKYAADGATDANGRICPLLEVELLDDAQSYVQKRDEWTKIAKGERAAITASQANLKRALEEAALKPTDKVRIEFSGTYETKNGTGKEFSVKVLRGSGVTPGTELTRAAASDSYSEAAACRPNLSQGTDDTPMMYDARRHTATPGERSTCPTCRSDVLAKCGNLVVWHWAHVAADCDPWAEPESAWHLGWKSYLEQQGGRPEVAMGPHRADVVMPSGRVVELQSTYLNSTSIADREQFYGDMMWIYRCTWDDRLHWGKRGFWWKNGSKAMLTHQAPVWWHVDDRLVQVRLSGVETEDGATRVVGRVWRQMPAPTINPVLA